ncbi:MAG TPA: hypothetical protein DDY68_03755 [Porphyromonadaceae bacterium]|nr:hypothetical protein [Porphyromonadaceae bacterium]
MLFNIAICCDNRYVVPSLVTIISLFENNKLEKFHVYIITDNKTENNKTKFKKIQDTYKQTIEICEINFTKFLKLHSVGRYATPTYYRFVLSDIIKDDRVLYLDGDIIVRHNISELYNTPLEGFACAAVYDQNYDDPRLFNMLHLKEIYFNAGVLLININYWRKNNIANKLFDFILTNKEICPFQDQDGLNYILQGHVKLISPTYNFQACWYYPLKMRLVHFSKWAEIDKYKNDPVIVHFCDDYKPWYKECRHPFAIEWKMYGFKHDFINAKIIHRYSLVYRSFSHISSFIKNLIHLF